MSYETIDFEKGEDGVAHLTLKRPKAGNAINLQMAQEVQDAVIRCESEADIRAVLLTGEGRFFCTGGDVASFATAGEGLADLLLEITAHIHDAVLRLARMPKPVISAVNGPALGGGIGVALCADIVLADPSASFNMAYAGIGLSPDCGASWLLPRLIGHRKAVEMSLMNRTVTAEEASRIGLVTQVTGENQLVSEAKALATRLAQGPTCSYGAAKKLMQESWGTDLEGQLKAESLSISSLSKTHDGREGIAAFLARRPANFTGVA